MGEVFSERQLHWSMYKLNVESWCLSAAFSSRKEWRKVKERVLGSRWTFAYFQILLGNCEANYVYGNFSNCFSCRITDHKIMKAWLEKSLPFKLRAAQGRHRVFQLAAAELPHCTSTKQPSEVRKSPTKHQNKSQHSSPQGTGELGGRTGGTSGTPHTLQLRPGHLRDGASSQASSRGRSQPAEA